MNALEGTKGIHLQTCTDPGSNLSFRMCIRQESRGPVYCKRDALFFLDGREHDVSAPVIREFRSNQAIWLMDSQSVRPGEKFQIIIDRQSGDGDEWRSEFATRNNRPSHVAFFLPLFPGIGIVFFSYPAGTITFSSEGHTIPDVQPCPD
jgi:hypothetical protein